MKKLIITLSGVLLAALLGVGGWFFVKGLGPRQSVSVEGQNGKMDVQLEELGFYVKDDLISGKVYRPVTDAKTMPVVIYCHPFCSDRSAGDDLCLMFAAQGWVAYAFDFRGGSSDSKSTGLGTDQMSVSTEAADIATVVKHLKKLSYVQGDKIFLVGEGLGGYAALQAASKGLSVKGMALLNADLHRCDESLALYPKARDIPTKIDKGKIVLGKVFYKDARDFDPLKKASKVKVPTLVVHGTSDKECDYSYAAKVAQLLPKGTLVPLDGGSHQLGSSLRKKAGTEICSFFADRL